MSKRQINQEDVMKRNTWQVAAFLGVLLTTAVAVGQSNSVLEADIPFPFVAGDHTLPAGHYEVSTLGQGSIRISNSHHQGAFVLTSNADGRTPERSGKLVFNRYSGTYFLAQVWGPAKSTGKQVYKSRSEEQLKGEGINREIAVLRVE
jgi:hypothetical protein